MEAGLGFSTDAEMMGGAASVKGWGTVAEDGDIGEAGKAAALL